MGGHSHGHEPPYKVPDYSIYKVEGNPRLEELERALAEKGLKDPWIRNEAWRYNPGFGTKLQRARLFFFRGFLVGTALTALHVTYNKTIGGGGHGHGHGHEDGHGHEKKEDC